MNYLVREKEQIDFINSKLEIIPEEIKKHIRQARIPSTHEIHATMCHDHYNREKAIFLPQSLGTVTGVEAIVSGQEKLVMGITVLLKDGTKLFMLFEHLDLMLRVQFEKK